jgi:cell wall-associated NlpC family hydrolase
MVFALFLLLSFSPLHAIAQQEYRVQRGDTLSAIAKQTGITIYALKKANHIKGHILQINQILVIPSTKEEQKTANLSPKSGFYEVKKGDFLSIIEKKTGVSVEELRKINHLSSTRLAIGQKLLLEEKKEAAPVNDTPSDEQSIAATESYGENLASEKETNEHADASSGVSRQNKESYDYKEKLLGKWRYPEEQRLLVKVALGFLGAPYRRGGCSVKGMDCSGFVKKIYALFDIDLPRTAAAQSNVGMQVAKSDLSEGDLIFFKTKKRINHVGIYIGENKFVHSAAHNKGVRVDNLDSSYYKRYYNRAVRLKGRGDIPSSDEASASSEALNNDLLAQTSLAETHR